jgi:hypothetical protein
LLFQYGALFAQNTMRLEKEVHPPEASVEELAWLEGHWLADALGGTAEEIWAAPKAGAMMGMFRAERDNEISFYEFFTIREVDGSVLLQIKHFQRDLVGWEEKDETVDFPLVKLEERTVWFDGLTMTMIDESHLHVYVRSENRDGSESELSFQYRRLK